MKIKDITSPEDLLEFMKENIKYGWLDINGEEHIGNLKNFRSLYRTSTIEETLQHGIGTCIEQVYLMSHILNKLNIKNKMFCTRIYEGEDFNNQEEEEHMHCFLLYYIDNKVYQIEHPNWEKIGIYEYPSEEQAIKEINDYYIKMSKGKSRPVTQFNEVEPNLSFKQFNMYINNLDRKNIRIKLSDLTSITENIDLDKYITFREEVKRHMEHPDWLGDFQREDLIALLNNNSKIWIYYKDTEPICSMMLIPSSKKVLAKFELDLEEKDVVDYGPMFVNYSYIGNGLQYQMLQELDTYCKKLGYKYAASTIHPDNTYSINNLLKDNFKYHKTKTLKRGPRNIYLKKLDE